jgi:magnesium transporter
MPFRILDADGVSSDEARVAPPPAGSVRWIDLVAQDDAALALLAQRFDFHPLTIDDCRHFDQRAKLQEYSGALFLVVHGFSDAAEVTGVAPHELHAWVGSGFLVTVHAEAMAGLDEVWARVAGDRGLLGRGADFIYYLVADQLIDRNFAILDRLSDSLDEIEEAVLHRAERRDLGHIFRLKNTLVLLRRVLSPQRDVFALLSKRGHELIQERTSLYFRDLYDHLTRIYESIDAARDLLGNSLDAYLSMVAQRTNDVMKRLTLLSAIFLPLTVLTGFFGQNFSALPIGSRVLYDGMLAAMALIPAAMILWFRLSHWW